MKKFFCFGAMICLLCGCSSIPREREVTVADVDITGLLKDHVKVVDGTYMFTNDGRKASISVKLELVNQPSVEYHLDSYPTIRLNAIGEHGEVFDSGVYGFSASDDEFSKIEDLLTGDVGASKMISFTWKYFGQDKELGKKIFTKGTSFELIDKGFEYGEPEYDSDISTSSSPSNTSGSSNWDKVLDEYENYIDQYIALYKKAQNGDISAMSDYAKMLEKAESYTEKLSQAEGSMSASQMSRYVKLTGKLSSAFTE